MYSSLLSRQLKRYLHEKATIDNEWQTLLDAIDRSYEHYEKDNILGKQSLEITTNELKHLAMELSSKESRIRAILESASDGIIVVNDKNQIEMCNDAAVRLFGYVQTDDLVDKDVSLLDKVTIKNRLLNVSDQASESSLPNFSFVDSLRQHTLLELSISPREGKAAIPIEVSLSECTVGQKKLFICIIRDISVRRQIEKKIALRHAITKLLLKASNIEEVSNQILSTLCNELESEAAFFWLKHVEHTIKPISSFIANSSSCLVELKNIVMSSSDCLIRQVLKEDDTVFHCPHTSEIDTFLKQRNINFPEIRSYLCFNISFEDQNYGVIEIFFINECPQEKDLSNILHDIGAEIGMFISHQEAREHELNLQKELTIAARQAGMMQVATSVLHNVGNVLNSVNISTSVIRDSYPASELENYKAVVKLIEEHKDDIDQFIQTDDRGKYLLQYFSAFANWWEKEQKKFQKEIALIAKNLEHIKGIISLQQSMSNVMGTKESTSINQLLGDLEAMYSSNIERLNITVSVDCEILPNIVLERSKLIQILENLFHNALDALKAGGKREKILIIRTRVEQEIIKIEVIDNGCGIDPENLTKMFSFGFTTKKEGHGYGLHSSAQLAKEMGGELTVESRGVGQGATFRLILPLQLLNQSEPETGS